MKIRCFVLALLIFIPCAWNIAQATEPILHLNNQMHTAGIKRISTDEQGRYILTVSADKTAKVWDAQDGDLLRTLRIPIGHGHEGMLYAGALSPRGEMAAVSGWTSKNGLDNTIYFFNPLTGRMLGRLTGLENVVFDLEFSPNGRYLAVALGSGGVVIFKRQSESSHVFTRLKSLAGYKNKTYNITFSPAGRLATVCWDGYLRLYDSQFNMLKEIKGAGQRPHSVSFSPDCQKIAVGYEDSKTVDVFDGQTLALLFQPNLENMQTKGGLSGLTFSLDGRYLYGAGYFSKRVNGRWQCMIRKWGQGGAGTYTDYAACGNVIMDLKSITVSGTRSDLIFAGKLPDFGRMNCEGTKLFYKTGEMYSFSNSQFKYLKINDTGNEVAFRPIAKPAFVFQIADRQLKVKPELAGLKAYSDFTADVNVTNWEDTFQPKINNQSVDFLRPFETCRAVDITADGAAIVWGANWSVYCTNKKGEKLWRTPVQSEAWAVNIASNAKTVVAALGDGTLNWYSMRDGALLLTLYIHPETEEWVLFTPKGCYDAAPGAEHLIGWHVNNGPETEALFYQVSKFRNTYYRPDVIDRVLENYDLNEALWLANQANNRKEVVTKVAQMLPPVVHILSPHHNSEVTSATVELDYQAISPGGELVTEVKFLVDGRPAGHVAKIPQTRTHQHKKLTIPKKNVLVQVMARNEHGWSEAAAVRLKWQGQRPVDVLKPNLYVLAIGVSDYQNNDFDLKYAAKDAIDFASAIKHQQGGLYKNVTVNLLTNQSATKNDILDGLEWIQKETTARDMAMIFLAGHGINDNLGSFYYLPHKADLQRMRRTCLMFSDLKYTTSAIAGKVVAFVDACHSGSVMGGRRAPDVNGLINELTDVESGAVVFTSSTGRQFSLEAPTWENGAFTEAVVEGFLGKADLFGKGSITIKSLDAYVAERVKELTDGQQSPTAVIPQSMPDFPIGVVR